MEIKEITKNACSIKENYKLYDFTGDSMRETYLLESQPASDDPQKLRVKKQCFIIYNDIITKSENVTVEKIYIEPFFELPEITADEIYAQYPQRKQNRLSIFFDEKSAAKYINTQIKKFKTYKKNRLIAEKEIESIDDIMAAVLEISDALPEMKTQLEMVNITTKEGEEVIKDCKQLINLMNKIIKRKLPSDVS